MQLDQFSAQRFRNLAEIAISLSSGMNVIYGDNAQGKTNLLEAVYVLSTLRSFRTRNFPELMMFGENTCLVEGVVHSGQSKHMLSVSLDKNARHVMLDRKKADPLYYLGVLNVFQFSYPLLEVVRGGPEDRRKFFDRSISVSRPGYLPVLMQYHRALKQKTALLGMLQKGESGKREGLNSLTAFNEQLLEYGLEIVGYRTAYLGQLQELLREKQNLFFEKELNLELKLNSSFQSSKEDLVQVLESAADREIARGMCLYGVHRDEIRMSINGKELRKYGSSGQHRAFLLLVLLAQLNLYELWRNDRPVLLLDDLDSELDEKRIHAFLRVIQNRYQTLISSSRRELFERSGTIRFFEIKAGKMLEM